MKTVKDTLELLRFSACDKANNAMYMKSKQPENAEFWQGQYQAFCEIHTMLTQMNENK